ncbi:MAG: hypothetical protein Kow0069_31150 [Promethearchaeota archaeon]
MTREEGPEGGKRRTKSISVDARLYEKLLEFKRSLSQARRVTWNEGLERLLEAFADLSDLKTEFERLSRLIESLAQRPVMVAADAAVAGARTTPPAWTRGGPPLAAPPPPPPTRPGGPPSPAGATPSATPRMEAQAGSPPPELLEELHEKFKQARSGLKSAEEAVRRETKERREALRRAAEAELADVRPHLDRVGIKFETLVRLVMAAKNLDPERATTDALTRRALASVQEILKILSQHAEELRSEAESLRIGFAQNPEPIVTELEEKLDSDVPLMTQKERKRFITERAKEIKDPAQRKAWVAEMLAASPLERSLPPEVAKRRKIKRRDLIELKRTEVFKAVERQVASLRARLERLEERDERTH